MASNSVRGCSENGSPEKKNLSWDGSVGRAENIAGENQERRRSKRVTLNEGGPRLEMFNWEESKSQGDCRKSLASSRDRRGTAGEFKGKKKRRALPG